MDQASSSAPRSRLQLLRRSLPLLAFGLLLTFFSSFGQTFLLSLYVPSIERLLGISNTAFGSLYAAATLSSAFTLPWLGGRFDKMDIRRYTFMVTAGLMTALLLLSFSVNVIMVVIAFYGLRLFGQGLMSHTSVSAMARYFSNNRGKAIGIATLGHPAGEATLPLLITLLIGAIGWRMTLQVSALSILILVLPLSLWLLYCSRERLVQYSQAVQRAGTQVAEEIGVWQLLRERRFWIIAPLVFIIGYTNTAIFFFQLKLGEARGWSPEWVAGSLSAFALASALGMAGSGPLVDRLSARRLFPVFLLPYLLGLSILIFYRQAISYPLALLFMGLANGAGSTIKNALLAEVYGIRVIGRVRSVFTTVMVVSTALGPVTFGLMLDADWPFALIFTAVAGIMLLTVMNGWRQLSG